MKIINDAIKSWTEFEIKVLEKYKYNIEGPHRTDGSYILTFLKSSLTAAEKDPEMYNVKLGMEIGLITTAVGTSAVIGYAVGKKVSEHKNNKLEEKEID